MLIARKGRWMPSLYLLLLATFGWSGLSVGMASAQGTNPFSTLYNFGANDTSGVNLFGGLVEGGDGNYYGTTENGGEFGTDDGAGYGTVFQITPGGTVTSLYSFGSTTSTGTQPRAGLIVGPNGSFYGTTDNGGAHSLGVVYEITSGGAYSVVYNFGTNTTDGHYPQGPLDVGSDGNFYGTTLSGGVNNDGTIFQLTPAGTLTTLYSFGANATDGISPYCSLVQASDGDFYGTTNNGGANNQGCVFKIPIGGIPTIVHNFGPSASDGVFPYAGLTIGSDGNLYGTTTSGGSAGGGTVYQVVPGGAYATVYNFGSNADDGTRLVGTVIQGANGAFYGETAKGGADNYGTLYQITGFNAESTIYSFNNSVNEYPSSDTGLVLGSDDNLYGTTQQGGEFNGGTVFRYLLTLPAITSFSPTSGLAGTVVTITGTNFTDATEVAFGGVDAVTFSVTSATSITATVPAGAATGPISVTTPVGKESSTSSFTVIPTPTITSFTPASGPTGTTVTITGMGLTGASSVAFNGALATAYTVNSDTSITATVPTNATTGTITVDTPNGNATSSASFTVIPMPAVTAFSPASGAAGADITITGKSLTGATAVSFNGTAATTFNVDGTTTIKVLVPTGATTGKVSVTTPGGTATSTSTFTVIPVPTITSFTPATAPIGAAVTVTGTNFTGATSVTFDGTEASKINVVSATSLRALVPSGASPGKIAVTTSYGTATSGGIFTPINPPTITSFSPASGPVKTVVTITGTNLSGATGVKFGTTSAATIKLVSATSLMATVPAGATSGAITVTTPGGTATSATSFTVVPVPTISSFTPVSGPTGTTVTITGTNLTGATAVRFNSTAAATYTVVSATSITAVVPSGATSGKITVTTPGGTATSAASFTVAPVPTITSFSPASGPVGAVVTITGTSLTGTTTVTFNGTPVTKVTVVSSTSVRVQVPAGATTGPVALTTPGGTATSTTSFTVG